MARVLLIKSGGQARKLFSPPLGLMYLAAYAREQRPGADAFRLEDTRIIDRTPSDWREVLDEFRPDLIALSALTVEAPETRSLAVDLKSIAPALPIALGGPHASAIESKALKEGPYDYVVSGEGEISFVRILEALERDERVPSEPVPGLNMLLDDGSLRSERAGSEVPDIDALPFPAWDLIDIESYADFARMSPFLRGRYAAVFSSRGCPYRCTYCHEVFSKGFRAMSPSRLVDELEYISKTYDVHEFEFFDDIFNADHDRSLEICREIKARGLDLKLAFPNGLRADRLSEPLLVALKEAGTNLISVAIETASPRLQKQIRKHMKLDKLANAVRIAADLRIPTYGFFMLGFPTETMAEARATIDYAAKLPLHGASFFVTMPYEGTEMHDELEAAGIIDAERAPDGMGEHPWDPDFGSNQLSEMTAEQLKSLQRTAYLKFYLRPSRIMRVLRDCRLPPKDFARRAYKMVRYSIVGDTPSAGPVPRPAEQS